MRKWICLVCDYVYDPEVGDETQDIPPDTPFRDLPDNWLCPGCGVEKEELEALREE